jgi:hypothetical protein
MLILSKTPKLINFTYNDFADKLKQFLVKYDCPEFILFPICYEYGYDIPKIERAGLTFELVSLGLYQVTYFDKPAGNPFIIVKYKVENLVESSTIYTTEELTTFIPKDLLIDIYKYLY